MKSRQDRPMLTKPSRCSMILFRKRDGQAGRDTSNEIARKEVGEKVVLLERLMEEMSRLNAAYQRIRSSARKEDLILNGVGS